MIHYFCHYCGVYLPPFIHEQHHHHDPQQLDPIRDPRVRVDGIDYSSLDAYRRAYASSAHHRAYYERLRAAADRGLHRRAVATPPLDVDELDPLDESTTYAELVRNVQGELTRAIQDSRAWPSLSSEDALAELATYTTGLECLLVEAERGRQQVSDDAGPEWHQGYMLAVEQFVAFVRGSLDRIERQKGAS